MPESKVVVAPATSGVVASAPAPDFGTEAPEKPSTALLSLKKRREAIKNELYIDLQVPRWEEPEIFVRYGPMDATRSEKAIERRRRSKAEDYNVLANADILALSCIGIYACLDGDYDTKYSLNVDDPEGKWTRFDPDLARNLGITPADNAVTVVRGLYLTDGDLIQAASALVEWSGRTNAQIDTDFSTP